MSNPPRDALTIELYEQPGHLIRRAQQIAVSMFFDALGRDVTPVQYAILRMLQERPGIDQVTLAQEVALDTSTTADIINRAGMRTANRSIIEFKLSSGMSCSTLWRSDALRRDIAAYACSGAGTVPRPRATRRFCSLTE